MWYVAHEQHLQRLWRWCSMILKWDDGASGVPPMCFSMPVSQPSILSWHVVEARVGEHDLEDDGRHAPADVFSFRVRKDKLHDMCDGHVSIRTPAD